MLAANYSAVLTGMPHAANATDSRLADIVCQIADQQQEIQQDLATLFELQHQIRCVIEAMAFHWLQQVGP